VYESSGQFKKLVQNKHNTNHTIMHAHKKEKKIIIIIIIM